MQKSKEPKLVQCRCGGKAGVHQDYTGFYCVQCAKCGMTTMKHYRREDAIKIWNGVMSERIVKVVYGFLGERHCGRCDIAIPPTVNYNYCPYCGAKLEYENAGD